MIDNMKNYVDKKELPPQSKGVITEIPETTISNSATDVALKDFIPSGSNPDNNYWFDERSNHLSSKGD